MSTEVKNSQTNENFAMKETDGKPPFSYMTPEFYTMVGQAAVEGLHTMVKNDIELIEMAINSMMEFAHNPETDLNTVVDAAACILHFYKRRHADPGSLDVVKVKQFTMQAMTDYANVRAFGARKYKKSNWKKGIKFSLSIDAILRHLWKLCNVSWFDEDSLLPHLGHILCDMEHMIYFIGKQDMIKKLDDRFE